jgi:hypothetical protein
VAKVSARFGVRLRQVLQLSSGSRLGNGAAIAVGGAPSFARKVLRLAQAFDDLPGQFPLVGVGQGCSSPKFRSESSTARSGLRRPSRPIPIHGQRPAADVHVGRVASSPHFAVNFKLRSTSRSLQPCPTLEVTARDLRDAGSRPSPSP